MTIQPIETGFFSTDGGAMFGMVSRRVWSSKYPVDGDNRCPLAMRILFVDMGAHKVLFDTGAGTAKVHGIDYYKFHDPLDVREALARLGYTPEDITDVVLSHLHFDHCGGAAVETTPGHWVPTFPKATYWAGSRQRALTFNPSRWEADSYAPAVVAALEAAACLRLIDADTELFPGLRVEVYQGHTDDQLVSFIDTPLGCLVYAGDVIPMTPHVMPLCIAAVDNAAVVAVNEKLRLLHRVVEKDGILFFFHDAVTQATRLRRSGERVLLGAPVEL